MKTIFSTCLLTFLCVHANDFYPQETCKVLKAEISGEYSGKCKNGLAHGKGIARGIDTYEGKFKDGLPDGIGKYTWSNGEIYEGGWNEGKKEGEGKFYYKVSGSDSVRHGIWENDVYIHTILPKAFNILRSASVSSYSFRRITDGSSILFNITQNHSPTSAYSNFFLSTISGNAFTVGQKNGLENIIFPFKCRVTFSILNAYKSGVISVEFEFEITNQGAWELTLNI